MPLIGPYAFRDDCCYRHYGDNGVTQTLVITGPCVYCQQPQKVTVTAADAVKFQAGEHVQNCFPYITPGEREFLLSGICDTCWDKMFLEDDESDTTEEF